MVTVIGDFLIDLKIDVSNKRSNPEGNFPLYTIENKSLSIGGVGNVATILTSLDSNIKVKGIVGNDVYGQFIKNKFALVDFNSTNTILKKRYYLEDKYIFRIDDEKLYSGNIVCDDNILIISDYAKGTISEGLFVENKRIFINGKPKNYPIYKNLEWIQINRIEAQLMSGCDNVEDACKKIALEKDCNVIVTLGKKGSLVYENNVLTKFKFDELEVTGDVCCCGDIFFSIFSYLKIKAYPTKECINIASKYASENVKHIGVYLDWIKDFKY